MVLTGPAPAMRPGTGGTPPPPSCGPTGSPSTSAAPTASDGKAAQQQQQQQQQQGRSTVLRAGFHLVSRVTNAKPLRQVVFNTSRRTFTSTDEKGMRGWRYAPTAEAADDAPAASGGGEPFYPNAPKTTCFYSAVTYVRELALYFVAALDGTLRVYDDRMNELSRFRWAQGAVLRMVYNPALDELVTAGKHGIMFWRCRYDAAAANAWMTDNHVASSSSSSSSSAAIPGAHDGGDRAAAKPERGGARKAGADEAKSSGKRAKVSQSVFEGRRVPWRGGDFSELVLRHRIDQTGTGGAGSRQQTPHQAGHPFRRPPPSRGRESPPPHAAAGNADEAAMHANAQSGTRAARQRRDARDPPARAHHPPGD